MSYKTQASGKVPSPCLFLAISGSEYTYILLMGKQNVQ